MWHMGRVYRGSYSTKVSLEELGHLSPAKRTVPPTDSLTNSKPWIRQWWDGLAIAAACVFVLLAAYRIELPGLFYDEMDFVNAAQGAPHNTFIHMRVGSVPPFISPYLGALFGELA
jgi:hypothetical protein